MTKESGTWVQVWCEKCFEYVTVFVVKGKAKCPRCGKDLP